jgi:hypothetical protein
MTIAPPAGGGDGRIVWVGEGVGVTDGLGVGVGVTVGVVVAVGVGEGGYVSAEADGAIASRPATRPSPAVAATATRNLRT